MTIAACYVSGEGVVFGADSTTTMLVAGRGITADQSEHHFEHAQKIFEVGEGSTLGVVTWGMGNLEDVSFRTLIALFADSLRGSPAGSMREVADRWNAFFWNEFAREMQPHLQRAQALLGLPQPTEEERDELENLRESVYVGFCLGGHLLHDRKPCAFEIQYDATMTGAGAIDEVVPCIPRFWGTPTIIDRLIVGIDTGIIGAILRSGMWTGSRPDLLALVRPYTLGHPLNLPIREALDWIHGAISTTIHAIKFSHLAPTCGGPIELAVITSDRAFRWVCHKRLGSALPGGSSFDE